jgi:hypothetical protein
MQYYTNKNLFCFHTKETNEGAIYDGRIKTKMPHGFAVKTVWQGECSQAELIERMKKYDKNKRNY